MKKRFKILTRKKNNHSVFTLFEFNIHRSNIDGAALCFVRALKLQRETVLHSSPLPPPPLGIYRDPQPFSRYLSAAWSGADRFNRYFFPRWDNRSARIIRDKRERERTIVRSQTWLVWDRKNGGQKAEEVEKKASSTLLFSPSFLSPRSASLVPAINGQPLIVIRGLMPWL